MNKTAIKTTTVLFLLADLRDKFYFPRNCQLAFILGGLGWSRCERRPGELSCPLTAHPGTLNNIIALRDFGTGHRRDSRSEQKSSRSGSEACSLLQEERWPKRVVSVEIVATHFSLEGPIEGWSSGSSSSQQGTPAPCPREQHSPNSVGSGKAMGTSLESPSPE